MLGHLETGETAQGPKEPGCEVCKKIKGLHSHLRGRAECLFRVLQKTGSREVERPLQLLCPCGAAHTWSSKVAFSDLGIFSMKEVIWCHPDVPRSKNGDFTCFFFKGVWRDV